MAEQEAWARVGAALRAYPLARPPATLAPAVMARVRRLQRPRFRLEWTDYALSLFATGMVALTWWLLRSILPQIAQFVAAEWQLRLMPFTRQLDLWRLWPMLAMGLLLALVSLLLSARLLGGAPPALPSE